MIETNLKNLDFRMNVALSSKKKKKEHVQYK